MFNFNDLVDFDNLLEYADPVLYDAETTEFEPEGPFYLELAQRLGGKVLELGCGTGRFTIPLAQSGIPMVGLDVAPQMLAHAKRKAPGLPIRWVEADVREFHLDERFRLIIETGNTFQHLLRLEDQEATLARVREHLARRLIFPQEMEMLLHYNGFAVTERYGGWDKSPLTNASRSMIYVCRAVSSTS